MTPPYVQLPKPILASSDLTPATKLVYASIADRIGHNGKCWPGLRRIASDISLNASTVLDSVRRLEATNLIIIDRRGNGFGNTYRLTPESDWILEASEKSQRLENPSGPQGKTKHQAYGITTHNYPKVTKPITKPRRKRRDNPLPDISIPDVLNTPEFLKAWREWSQHLKEKKKPATPMARNRQLKKCEGIGVKRAIAMIDNSITGNYQGLYEAKDKPQNTKHTVPDAVSAPDNQCVDDFSKWTPPSKETTT